MSRQEEAQTAAIESAIHSQGTFCKFLSANDSGETGGHQSGILISTSARSLAFTQEEIKENHIIKKNVKVCWQNDLITDSCITWYESKGEIRLTKFGRGFPWLQPEYTGALFVLTKQTESDYSAFILNSDDNIQGFLDAFGITPAETNCLVDVSQIASEAYEQNIINAFIQSVHAEFPASERMSAAAREIYEQVFHNGALALTDPDKILLDWTAEEYTLFRSFEQANYGAKIKRGFSSVEEFITTANAVLNRRKSRAGKSLEHHLAALFDINHVMYAAQGITEGKKRPDFIFPSEAAYHDETFSIDKICSLAAKTTCKDRWRQVLNESDRLKDSNKYLCTLQQGISSTQLDEMKAEKVVLVVPKPYIAAFPRNRQPEIWTAKKFIGYVRQIENIQ